MKKLLILLMIMPFVTAGQKNLVSTERIFPKVDKVLEFEKALAAHAQKYHKGDYFWRVFEIQSGPDAGGYHITEGPTNWETYDTRGNLGTEHNTDWNKSVTIYLTDKSASGFSLYNEELSTDGLTNFSDKILITHNIPKPGKNLEAMEMFRKMKKVWVADNEKIAVYTSSASGPPQITTVARLHDGLKELTAGYRKPIRERFDAVHGADAWLRYLQAFENCIQDRWSELLFFRADLSSK
jgi:hypothetical protein